MQLDVSLNATVGLGAPRALRSASRECEANDGLPESARVYDRGLWQGREVRCPSAAVTGAAGSRLQAVRLETLLSASRTRWALLRRWLLRNPLA